MYRSQICLVVVKVSSFDRICRTDAICLVLIVDRQVCQMCLESPVRRGIHTSRGKCALNTQLIFLCLDIICNCFQSFKVVEFIDR